jgi:guanosine-3',5'-bis(diphosphate) 3'-pyrophosphohydrolase
MITFGKAREWCIKAHGEQKYGDSSYSVHLDDADRVALRFGIVNPYIRVAIQGHDVPEDTEKTIWQMWLAGFPLRSLLMVWLVTDRPGRTRDERKARTLPLIALHRGSILVKLCDRIANVEEGIFTKNRKFYRYVKEYDFFRACLYNANHLEAQKMWEHLDELLGYRCS